MAFVALIFPPRMPWSYTRRQVIAVARSTARNAQARHAADETTAAVQAQQPDCGGGRAARPERWTLSRRGRRRERRLGFNLDDLEIEKLAALLPTLAEEPCALAVTHQVMGYASSDQDDYRHAFESFKKPLSYQGPRPRKARAGEGVPWFPLPQAARTSKSPPWGPGGDNALSH